jgi:hypothetical protein
MLGVINTDYRLAPPRGLDCFAEMYMVLLIWWASCLEELFNPYWGVRDWWA